MRVSELCRKYRASMSRLWQPLQCWPMSRHGSKAGPSLYLLMSNPHICGWLESIHWPGMVYVWEKEALLGQKWWRWWGKRYRVEEGGTRDDQEAWLWAHVIATRRNLLSVQSLHTNKQTNKTEALLRQGYEKWRKYCPTQQWAHRKIRGQSQLNDRMPDMPKPLGSILRTNKDKEVR